MIRPLFISALVQSVSVLSTPVCLGNTGKEVDWWFAYKLNSGTDFSYVDNNTVGSLPGGPLVLTGDKLDSLDSPLALTLTQLIENRASLARVQWNDELPVAFENSTNSGSAVDTNGHTKGVLGASKEGGFQLTHTLPKFPDLTTGVFTWGGASTLYAQNFLCVTLDAANIEVASGLAQYIGPHIYDSVVPSSLNLPNTFNLVGGARKTGTAHGLLKTATGDTFIQFGKSGSTGVDLYEDVVQAELKSDMIIETWRRSPFMPSYCSPEFPYESLNVNTVTFVDKDGTTLTRKYTQDHSKIAIVTGESGPYGEGISCVGDMNRMQSRKFPTFFPSHPLGLS